MYYMATGGQKLAYAILYWLSEKQTSYFYGLIKKIYLATILSMLKFTGNIVLCKVLVEDDNSL